LYTKKTVLILILLASLLLSACGTFEVGIEQAMPTPAPGVPGPLGAVAYVVGGDIWIKPLPGGAPWRITFDGRNSDPEWSASGSWIAFRKENALWLIRSDGSSAHPFPNEGSAWGIEYAWSPVGDRLAFFYYGPAILIAEEDALSRAFPTSDDMDNMYLFQPEDPPEGSNVELHGLAWSVDGTQLATVMSRYGPDTDEQGNQLPQYVGVWTTDTRIGSQASERYAAPSPPPDNLILSTWSPTSTSIYAWRDPGWSGKLDDGLPLVRLDLDPGNLEELPYITLLHSDFSSVGPNGRVAHTFGAGRETWQTKRIAIFEPDATTPYLLTTADVAATSPAWSPDGSQLTYSAMPDQGASVNSTSALLQRKIWVRDSDANAPPRQITFDESYRDERPQFSIDGSAILFARMDAAGRASVWLASLNDGGVDLSQVAPELTPSPDPLAQSGYISWPHLYDWWPGPSR
jgi:hypothetical protein